jgi:hypothetical protein
MVRIGVLVLGPFMAMILVLTPIPIPTLTLALALALIVVEEERLGMGVSCCVTREEGTRKRQVVVGVVVCPFAGQVEAGQIHGEFVVLC